jgi:hypothetical protein
MGGLGSRWLSASRVRVTFLLPPDPAIHEIFAPRYRVQTKLERVSIRPWSPTTVEYFLPLSYFGFRAASQASTCRSAEQTTEGVVARHPVSQTKKLIEEVLLGPGKDRHIYCCPAEPGCPPDRRMAAERGKMDGFDAVLLNRKKHQKTKNILYPSGAYLMSISKYG